MGYAVFAQTEAPVVPFDALRANAKRYFRLELSLLEQSGPSVLLGLDGETFRVMASPTTPDDLARAREAETAGSAAGMATLAERCRHVWRLETDAPESATLRLAAILASVALGPVLPPDGSTLFGVRGAMERAQKA